MATCKIHVGCLPNIEGYDVDMDGGVYMFVVCAVLASYVPEGTVPMAAEGILST